MIRTRKSVATIAIVLLILAAALTSGCSLIPSLDACDEVAYYRKGKLFSVQANCQIP